MMNGANLVWVVFQQHAPRRRNQAFVIKTKILHAPPHCFRGNHAPESGAEERLSAASKFKPRRYLTASRLWLRRLAALGEAMEHANSGKKMLGGLAQAGCPASKEPHGITGGGLPTVYQAAFWAAREGLKVVPDLSMALRGITGITGHYGITALRGITHQVITGTAITGRFDYGDYGDRLR
jgi:hypothetical protein